MTGTLKVRAVLVLDIEHLEGVLYLLPHSHCSSGCTRKRKPVLEFIYIHRERERVSDREIGIILYINMYTVSRLLMSPMDTERETN